MRPEEIAVAVREQAHEPVPDVHESRANRPELQSVATEGVVMCGDRWLETGSPWA